MNTMEPSQKNLLLPPIREVLLTGRDKPLVMMATPVTQDLYLHVMGENPACFQGEGYPSNLQFPAENVSALDAEAFCSRLSEMLGLTGAAVYRLPTETEWAWACTCGGSFQYPEDPQELLLYAHCNAESPVPVGEHRPNIWGLWDTLGNIWEWTASDRGGHRVLRGGSWDDLPCFLRAADRDGYDPADRSNSIGFRCCRNLGGTP